MTPRQHNPAMIYLSRLPGNLPVARQALPLQQRSAASRTPICYTLRGQHGPAMAANPFHTSEITGLERFLERYTEHMHPPVRLVAIDMDGTLLPTFQPALTPRTALALKAAQKAGITVAIATGRRAGYTTPILENLGLRADTPLITSNGAIISALGGEAIHRCHLPASTARALCGLLRPFGAMVFTFDRPGRGEMVLEDLAQAQGRIALWVEANRNAIEIVKPLEDALPDGEDPIQGMATGSLNQMRLAEQAVKASPWSGACECVRTEYPARDVSILDLVPHGVSKASALKILAARLGVDRQQVMAIGDNWNDVEMLEWAGQGVIMGNAAVELRALAETRGWRQAPPNNEDGVAIVLEAAFAQHAAANA
jgi:Cof subfamily protein (haloacid dehalogenase superfamily)